MSECIWLVASCWLVCQLVGCLLCCMSVCVYPVAWIGSNVWSIIFAESISELDCEAKRTVWNYFCQICFHLHSWSFNRSHTQRRVWSVKIRGQNLNRSLDIVAVCVCVCVCVVRAHQHTVNLARWLYGMHRHALNGLLSSAIERWFEVSVRACVRCFGTAKIRSCLFMHRSHAPLSMFDFHYDLVSSGV